MTQMLTYYCEENPSEEVYETLRAWRREQAARERKAPYILATNRVLRMISVFLPQSKEELQQIPGFGEQKTAMYADRLLESDRRVHTYEWFSFGLGCKLAWIR